ncbi:4-hydroxy-2-oxovalerate aldolase [Oceanobacillus rekensis]|uniref:4-hydroxy-2-oxovalerate aldolase n=1 Tax=Oceanobacillus rekensis TaxID=937927 RepID=UPI000B452223|nr:4-hydroxy-2-oxovalerate aldolase [Oceanobacillus rekensis]
MKRDVIITEVALRDGSHAMRHQFTEEQVRAAVTGLDEANVPYIEVTHGDGLGGSTIQYGHSLTDEFKLIEAAVETAKNAKIAVLSLPGIATKPNIKRAADLGVSMLRVATHVTEADVSLQHLNLGKELGLETVGFLMMSHMAEPSKIVEQAKIMVNGGADVIYLVDSAGALLPYQVTERIKALKQEIDVPVGFHAHNNLSLAVANSLAAIEAGAERIDGSIRCLGAGAGNTQTEVIASVLDKMGIQTGIDIYKIMDVAEDVIAPILPQPQEITRGSLVLGYAGVYSSFLLHANKASEKFGVDARDILMEIGKRKAVGGQEDMILEVAAELQQQ